VEGAGKWIDTNSGNRAITGDCTQGITFAYIGGRTVKLFPIDEHYPYRINKVELHIRIRNILYLCGRSGTAIPNIAYMPDRSLLNKLIYIFSYPC